jgi:hypothetical protein
VSTGNTPQDPTGQTAQLDALERVLIRDAERTWLRRMQDTAMRRSWPARHGADVSFHDPVTPSGRRNGAELARLVNALTYPRETPLDRLERDRRPR